MKVICAGPPPWDRIWQDMAGDMGPGDMGSDAPPPGGDHGW